MEVLIGVDPHKATNAAIDEGGRLIELAVFPTNRAGLRALERWGKRFEKRRWAVEGAGGLGRPVAQRLAAAGERVVDVPPKLSARVRLLSAGNERKNDALDATYTALAALRGERLAEVREEDRASVLRILTERREDLVGERTRTLNRLHGLLCDLLPGGAVGGLSAERAAGMLRRARPRSAPGRIRRQLASELVRDVRRLGRRVHELDRRIREALSESPTKLTEVFGIGPVLAARSSGGSRTSPVSPPRPTSLPTPVRRLSKSRARASSITASPVATIGSSTMRCTWSPSARSPATRKGKPTTGASSPRESPRGRRYARSNGVSPTRFSRSS